MSQPETTAPRQRNIRTCKCPLSLCHDHETNRRRSICYPCQGGYHMKADGERYNIQVLKKGIT